MMISPNCPQHRDLVLELALGRLDDDSASSADDARLSCDHCSTWWATTFSAPEAQLVEQAVTEVLTSVELPRQQRRQPWIAVAAAAVIVFAASTMWLEHRAPSNQANPTVATATDAIAVEQISAFDFENGQAVVAASLTDDDVLVTASFESGSLEISQSHEESQMLSSLSFESGSLNGLVPTT